MHRPHGGLEQALETIRAAGAEAGRDLSGFPFEGRLEYAVRDLEKMVEHMRRWREAGATHLSVNTMHSGLDGVDAHIAALREIAEAILP